MRVNNQNKTHILYFSILVLWMWIVIYTQSYAFYMLPKFLQNVDIATISMLCICIENSVWLSFFIAILSGALLDSISTIKPGFFMLYFLLCIMLIQVLSRFLSYENLSNKFIIFAGLFLFKFLLLYLLIDDDSISIFNFISANYIQFFISLLLFFVLAKMISLFKFIFETQKYSNRSYFQSSL